MTGPCSGANVGVAKAGTAAVTYVGPGAIGGALASLSGWQGAAVGAAIGTLTYELVTFCPAGPAAQPTFTIGDIAALLNPVVTPDKLVAIDKFRDFLSAVFWPLLCECSGGTVTAPAPATYPSGGPGGLNVYSNSAPCRSMTLSNATCFGTLASISAWPPSGEVTGGAFSLLNQSVTSVRLTARNTICTGAGSTISLFISYQDASNTTVRNDSVVAAPGATVVLTSQPPINADRFVIAASSSGSGTSKLDGSTVERFCNGTLPGAPSSPCCPPDPSLQAQLDAIYNLVTLIQRQSVPFSYVLGTAHTALSGAGNFDIQGLIGVKVNVTTLPASYGLSGTSPGEHFDLGWLTFGTDDGFPSSIRLERETQFTTPARCSVFTNLAYDLAPGIVVTITELEREP